jgi:hypothetical protein
MGSAEATGWTATSVFFAISSHGLPTAMLIT